MAGFLDTLKGLFGGQNAAPNTPPLPSSAPPSAQEGSGGVLGSITSIIGSIGSVFVSYKNSEAKQTELETAKVEAKSANSLAAKNIALETIKLKTAEITAAQKAEKSQAVLTGSLVIAAIVFMGYVLYLLLSKPKAPKVTVAPTTLSATKQIQDVNFKMIK